MLSARADGTRRPHRPASLPFARVRRLLPARHENQAEQNRRSLCRSSCALARDVLPTGGESRRMGICVSRGGRSARLRENTLCPPDDELKLSACF